jgi:hypothetical protein
LKKFQPFKGLEFLFLDLSLFMEQV